ncbi:glycosyl transferase family 1 [Acidithiobacillus thiooxidans]|uniref:Glycosyl transferase family 1 n=1 Tax=Acidithiobacillus thiooxidans TaxID=930 RepID=A0A1C2IVF2_ACITH|nr:GT4 family glycosyltransferase PelF [Acidithiobacillus thiooxidans]OCX69197.1 glycosyl transferase family 1 [Acidithiobacillus thiooxidans]OCX79973.1 glycosyl transferase family 1 [Acidithiobacillus thiooxidans]OCX85621.1 glycosyl transferase family 1 [Acidithiobacillus thiooxidans]OCX85748.1 glycosyl transferase family 1 [Acidithiobacillus thiooxidans]
MIPVRKTDSVDILLVLEGTFPYVRGGVSSWVNRLILGFPEYRFGVIFLGSTIEDYTAKPYVLPDNIHYYAEYFLYGANDHPGSNHYAKVSTNELSAVRDAHQEMKECLSTCEFAVDISQYGNIFNISQKAFFEDRKIWDYFIECYSEIPDQPSFVDYFWTIRGMHAPLWFLQMAMQHAPQSRIVHCPSTGYAGYLGALLSKSGDIPLIISEHGIYTKERRIDLMLARWIHEDEEFLRQAGRIHYLRHLWIRFFEFIGRLTYQQAQHIINLYTGVVELQIADGADPKKLSTIPNGIPVENFINCRFSFAQRKNIVALVGRVVPIKDIKTFIRAAKLIQQTAADTPEFWIAGPVEEDEQYYQECLLLVEHLGLGEKVKFLGYVPVQDVLRQVRITVLSSISEGLPLSVLESFAAGVPVVATDVGSCRELVYGTSKEDSAEPAGRIVPIANPNALAKEIHSLMNDSDIWTFCSKNAIDRVEKNYREEYMFASYRSLYQAGMAN